jgi:Protein of unknown function (DUF2934)
MVHACKSLLLGELREHVCGQIHGTSKKGDFWGEFPYSGYDIPMGGIPDQRRRSPGMADTTEKVKKAKAPAKPRAAAGTVKKTTAKKQTVAEKVIATTPSHEEIARLAKQYWEERGYQDGQAEQDWLRAEQELMKMAS